MGGISRTISLSSEQAQIKTIIEAAKKGQIQELIYDLIEQQKNLDEKIVHVQGKAATTTNTMILSGLLKEQLQITQTLDKIKDFQPNAGWYNFGMRPPKSESVIPGEMRPGAGFESPIPSVQMIEMMAEAARGLPPAIKETAVALDDMQKTLLSMGATVAFDALFEAGRSGSNIGEGIMLSLAKALPQQLLSAALSTIAAQPWNPVGWTMLAASGLAAFVGGAATGGIEKAQATRGGTSAGGSRAVNIVNVYGNVWAAGDLAATTAGIQGRW